MRIQHAGLLLAAVAWAAGCEENNVGPGPDMSVGCTAPMILCGATCIDPAADGQNCGACGTRCAPGEACKSGVCTVVCPGGQVLCGKLCVELRVREFVTGNECTKDSLSLLGGLSLILMEEERFHVAPIGSKNDTTVPLMCGKEVGVVDRPRFQSRNRSLG